jgi:hypothetical protein
LEEDTDYAAELEEELQLDSDGSPWLTDTSAATSMDSPRASNEDWLRRPATGGIKKEFLISTIKEEVISSTLKKELPLDMADTMMTKTSSMISSDRESNG